MLPPARCRPRDLRGSCGRCLSVFPGTDTYKKTGAVAEQALDCRPSCCDLLEGSLLSVSALPSGETEPQPTPVAFILPAAHASLRAEETGEERNSHPRRAAARRALSPQPRPHGKLCRGTALFPAATNQSQSKRD